jgi:hypothetical protein
MSQLFPERPLGASPSAVRVSGAEALVAGIAMKDFMRQEAEGTSAAGGLLPDGGILLTEEPDSGWLPEYAPFHQCANTASNYTTWVELDAGSRRWRVYVEPSGACLKDAYGGDAEYEIDADSYEILNRQLGE